MILHPDIYESGGIVGAFSQLLLLWDFATLPPTFETSKFSEIENLPHIDEKNCHNSPTSLVSHPSSFPLSTASLPSCSTQPLRNLSIRQVFTITTTERTNLC